MRGTTSDRNFREAMHMAKMARKYDDRKEAKKYYQIAMFYNPNDWESEFFYNYYVMLEAPISKLYEDMDDFNRDAIMVLEIILHTEKTKDTYLEDYGKSMAKIYSIIADRVDTRRRKMVEQVISNSEDSFIRELTNINNSYIAYQERKRREIESSEYYIEQKNCLL